MRKYLIPDSNDQIRQQQMREIQVKKKLIIKLTEDMTSMSNISLSSKYPPESSNIHLCPQISTCVLKYPLSPQIFT